LQIPLRTQSTVEAYIANREWRDAHLSACPLHPSGGCSLSRHGSYARVTPQGLRIARWYCPEARKTFSLLPDFLAARLPGLLDTIQICIAAVQSARSMEAAADLVRGPEVTLPGAIRWLRRRVRAVRIGIATVFDLMPELPGNVGIDETDFLRALRQSLPMTVLTYIPAPLGFGARCQIGNMHDQHEVGPDSELGLSTVAHHATPTATTDASYSNPHRGRHAQGLARGPLRAGCQRPQLHPMDQVVSLLCRLPWIGGTSGADAGGRLPFR
jgi:hypothetical protein